MLLDTGTATTFGDAILPFMKSEGFTRIHMVINLHAHPDHIGSNSQVKEYYGSEILCHKSAGTYLGKPEEGVSLFERYSEYFPSEVIEDMKRVYRTERGHPCSPDRLLSDGDIVMSNGVELEVIAAPGHCDSMICMLDRDDRVLYASDAIQGEGLISKRGFFLPAYDNVEEYSSSMHKLTGVNFNQLVLGHPYVPYGKPVLNRSEALDLIDRSLRAVDKVDRTILACLEGKGQTVDFFKLTTEVHRIVQGEVTAQALCTIEAHIRRLMLKGLVQIDRDAREGVHVSV